MYAGIKGHTTSRPAAATLHRLRARRRVRAQTGGRAGVKRSRCWRNTFACVCHRYVRVWSNRQADRKLQRSGVGRSRAGLPRCALPRQSQPLRQFTWSVHVREAGRRSAQAGLQEAAHDQQREHRACYGARTERRADARDAQASSLRWNARRHARVYGNHRQRSQQDHGRPHRRPGRDGCVAGPRQGAETARRLPATRSRPIPTSGNVSN